MISYAACFPRRTALVPSPILNTSPAPTQDFPKTMLPLVRRLLSGRRPVQMLITSMPSTNLSVPGIGLKFSHSAMIAPTMPSCLSFGMAFSRVCDVMTGMPRRRTLLAWTGKPPSWGMASMMALTFAPACIAWYDVRYPILPAPTVRMLLPRRVRS